MLEADVTDIESEWQRAAARPVQVATTEVIAKVAHVKVGRLEIRKYPDRHGYEILLDGEKVNKVRSAELRIAVGEAPTLKIETLVY